MSESKELANRKLGEDVVGLVGGKEKHPEHLALHDASAFQAARRCEGRY